MTTETLARVRELVKADGRTFEEIGHIAGISGHNILRWQRVNPRLANVEAVLEVIGYRLVIGSAMQLTEYRSRRTGRLIVQMDRIRQQKGLSFERLGELSGIGEATIKNWGISSTPYIGSFERVLSALGHKLVIMRENTSP